MAGSIGKFFVGGLAAETTEDHLRAHFEQYGELVDVAVMKDSYGIPRCFGFVQYADPYAHTCRPTDEHLICGKKVDVKAAVPKEAIDQGAPIRTNKIFVGGLSKASTADSIRQHFLSFGNVTEVLMKFNEMGESRGFCFVEFDNEGSAELAVQTQGQVVDEKEVECKLARPLGAVPNGKGKGKGKGDFGKGGWGIALGKGKGGPMRPDFFGGKGMRPSPYGAPPMKGAGGKGYGAPYDASSYGRGGYGKGAYGAAPSYGGRGTGAANGYGAAPGYGAPAYGAPAASGYAAAPSYSAPAAGGYGASAGYGAAAGYGGYSAATPAASYSGYGGYGQAY